MRVLLAGGLAWSALSSGVLQTRIASAVESSDAELRTRFLKEGPAAWKNLEGYVFRSQGTIDEKRLKYPPPAPGHRGPPEQITRTKHYFLNDQVNGAKVLIEADSEPGAQAVYGANADYRFQLSKQDAHQQLSITRYSPNPAGSNPRDHLSNLEASTIDYLLAAETVEGAKLRDMIDGSMGRLSAAAPVEVNGKAMLRLDFERRFTDSNKTFPCWAILDPDQHWAITVYAQQYPWGFAKATIEYQPEIKQVAFPRRVTREQVTAAGAITDHRALHFSQPQPCTAGAQQFTLEAFNLERPHSPGKTGGGRLLRYALMNGIILVAVGIWFSVLFYRRHRRTKGAE